MIYISLMHCFVYVVLYHKWAVNLRGSDQDNIEGLIYVALPRIMSLIFLWHWASNELLINAVFKWDGFIDSELLFSLSKTSVSLHSSPQGTFHSKERLRLSDRNSILMTQINVYIKTPVVMGFQI